MSLKDRIKASVARDVTHETVEVPEWTDAGEEPLKVDIYRVGLQSRNIALAKARKGDGSINMTEFQTSILARTMRDPETGELVYDTPDEAMEALRDANADVIDRLVKYATKGVDDPAKAVEDAGKGSSSTASDGSSSFSLSG